MYWLSAGPFSSAAGAHPFHAPGGEYPGLAGRILVAQAALEEDRDRGDTGVGMDPAHARAGSRHRVEVIQEHERFDPLACTRGAHHAGNRAVVAATGAEHDAATFNDQALRRAPLNRQGFHVWLISMNRLFVATE